MEKLKVALIQSDLFWEEKEKNIQSFDKKIAAIKNVDLILLPETFTTGFAMKKVGSLAEPMDGPTVHWMLKKAAERKAVICGTIMIKEDGENFNRLLWITPDGEISYYNKRHLFRLAYEQNYFTPGDKQKIVTLKGWNICLNVCYDLRFPVWCRNTQNNYDLLLFTANWPEPRILHWNSLLQSRAIENLSYVIGCNRVGVDGTGKNHTGDSSAYSPTGERLIHSNEEKTLYVALDKVHLESTRNRFQFYKDADAFKIKMEQ